MGSAICRSLAADFSRVAIHCNRSEDLAESLAAELTALGMEARVFPRDLTMPGAGKRLAADVMEWSGNLALLVNNAATFVRDDGELTDLARMKALNYDAAAALLDACVPGLEITRGSVVNIADVAGFKAFEGFKAYSSTKRALLDLTFRRALELAPMGVRVNAVCPGAVLFPEWYSEETKKKVLDGIPMGAVGSPEDIAGAVAYLANAGFVTGQALCVDGGRMLVIDQA